MPLLCRSGKNRTATTTEAIPDITMTWVGFTALFIFLVGYYVVAAEEKYGIDKAKPALFIGTFIDRRYSLAIEDKYVIPEAYL